MSKITNPDKVYGQTISFRYYLEKRVKPKMSYWNEKEHGNSYPLYIQIKVRQQTAQRKSILGVYLPTELLDNYLREHSQLVNEEKKALKDKILAQKPFENAYFSLSEALNGYSAFQEDICYLIGELLIDDYRNARISDSLELMKSDPEYSLPGLEWGLYGQTEEERQSEQRLKEQEEELTRQARSIFSRDEPSYRLPPRFVFSEVRDLAICGKPNVKALYDKYGKHFWGINRYCNFLRDQTRQELITLDTFLSPSFRRIFIKHLSEEVYEAVFEGINKLRQEKPSFERMLLDRGL